MKTYLSALHSIEFFCGSDGLVEALLVSPDDACDGERQWPARCLRAAIELAPAGAVMDEALGRVWGCLVICSPEYAAFHRAMLAPPRPVSPSRIFFLKL